MKKSGRFLTSYLSFLLLISNVPEHSFGQTTSGTVTFQNQTFTNGNYTARDKIRVLPNSNGQPSGNDIVHLYIDENIIPPSVYAPTPSNTYPINTSLIPGVIQGTAGVSGSGAASYSIPVFIPHGSANIQPQLSIVYNSQVGNGIMGTGWQLAGLSAISRTSSSPYYDGFPCETAVLLNNNDQFSLDGIRLINSGGYYHTEEESFSKIESFGSSGNNTGPSYFILTSKEGNILEYGNTSDSKVEVQGIANAPVIMWRLNKVTDANGNYMSYYYREENGESFIDRIEYTASNAQPNFFNKIKFYYDRRTDQNTYYISGYSLPQTVVLSSIRSFADGVQVRDLNFTYSYDANSGTHLSYINEIGEDGTQVNPTVIHWNTCSNPNLPDPNLNSGAIFQGDVPNTNYANIKYAGDFNGDGFTDYFVVHALTATNNGDTWELYLNDGGAGFWNGVSASGNMPPGYVHTLIGMGDENHRVSTIDADGDGKDDLLVPVSNNYGDQFTVMHYTGSGFTNGAPWMPSQWNNYGDGRYCLSGDFDGDGATDLFVYYYDHDDWYIHSWKTNQTHTGSVDWGNSDLFFTAINFDGDSKDEIMFTYNNPSNGQDYNYILGLNTSGTISVLSHSSFPNSCQGEKGNIYQGDFNGDGKTDLLAYNNCSGNWEIGYATRVSSATFPVQYTSFSVPFPNQGNPYYITNNYEYLVSDFNGDGKSDIAVIHHTSANDVVTVYYSLGNNVFHQAPDIIIDSAYPYNFSDWVHKSQFVGDFNGDGHADIMFSGIASFYNSGERTYGVYFFCSGADGFTPIHDNYNRVGSITNGFNETVYFDYNTLPELSVKNAWANYYEFYIKSPSPATFPIVNIQKPIAVVARLKREDGIGGDIITKYGYNGAKAHAQGKGFLGFESITSTVGTTSLNVVPIKQTISSYAINNSNVLFTHPDFIKNYMNNGSSLVKISETNYTYNFTANGKIFYSYLSHSEESDLIKNVFKSSDFTYDVANGNLLTSVETFNDGISKSVTNTYGHFGTWGTLLNKLTHSTATQTYPLQTSYSRTKDYNYDSQGNLSMESSDQGTLKEVRTVYHLNTAKFTDQTTVSAPNSPITLNARVTQFEYDTKYRFVTKVINPQNQQATKEYNSTGNILSEKDINNQVTSYEYDGFGNLRKTHTPQGHVIQNEAGWSSPSDPGLFYTSVTIPGRPHVKSFFDKLGREVSNETDGFNQLIKINKTYNNLGQQISVQEYYGTTPGHYENYTYNDPYNRITATESDGITTSVQYTPNSSEVTVTSPSGSSIKLFNSVGNILRATDNGGTVYYSYGSNGKPKSINVLGATATNIHYDNWGRQDQLQDPDAGTISYEYDAFGQLYTQTDANNVTYTNEYNTLGQITSKTCSDGTIYTYNYVTSGNGIGQFSSVTCSNGTSQSFQYDQSGRVVQFSDDVTGKNLVTNYQYDSYGNLTRHIYPSGFSTSNHYDPNGYLISIIEDAGNTSIWTLNTINAFGKPVKYSLGNSLSTNFTYDSYNMLESISTGNTQNPAGLQNLYYAFDSQKGLLNFRSDVLHNFSEDFNTPSHPYDNLNRINGYTANSGQTVSVTYDDNGNITNKSDAGAYIYDPQKVHAVARVNSSPNCAIPSATQNISYTSFNKITHIDENGKTLDFTYGPDQQRIKTVFSDGSNTKTKYFTADYEEEVTASGTRKLNYISGPQGLIAIYIDDGTNPKMYFVLKDHLGSIRGLVDAANGNLVEEYSFDAWGRRRDPATGAYLSTGTNPGYLIDRGFTGHEHLDEFGLINMNGRLYDPVLGRMLSPDNYNQASDFTQAFNRYSYAGNNPLIYTDPDGNWFGIDDVIVSAVGFTFGYLSTGFSTGNWGDKALANGAINAATFELSYLTCGGGLVAGGSMASAGSFLGWSGVNMGVSQFLPTIPIYQSSNFNLSISPMIGFGTSGVNFGINFNANARINDIVVAANYGIGYNTGASSLGDEVGGSNFWNAGAFIGWNDGHANYGAGYSYSSFSGSTKQGIGAITGQIGDFSLRFDEDYLGDGRDRYRTGGLLMTYKLNEDVTLAFGGSMMTGESNGDRLPGGNPNAQGGLGYYDNCGEHFNNLREGTMYGGIIYKGQAYFLGSNSEKRLHSIQNWIHRHKPILTSPYFEDRMLRSRLFSYFGTYNSNYLFY